MQIAASVKTKLHAFLEILYKTKGHIADTCSAVGISRRTFYSWRDKYPSFSDDVDAVFEHLVDDVELKLVNSVNSMDVPSIKFFLQAKGKTRGYGDDGKVVSVGGLKLVWENEVVQKTPKLPKKNRGAKG